MKKFIFILIVALIAAGFIFGPTLLAQFRMSSAPAGPAGPGPGRPGGPGGRQGGAGTVFYVRTTDAEIRNLEAYIEVNGNIVNEEQVTVVPEASGKLVSMKTSLGVTVNRGELIAEVDPSRPGSQYSLSPVYAPVSGVVVSNPLPAGSTVTTATPLLTIASGNTLEIHASIPEREVGQLSTGLSAEVRLEAFPGEIFDARIVRLSPVVDPNSRTKNIILRFNREDRRINAGMFARIKLNTRIYENVVSIPQDAVVESMGVPAVFILSGGSGETSEVNMRGVITGVTVDGRTEIKSGLDAGDKVVVQGQQFLTDGARVRVLGARL
jgi:multidrug efflux pump subunit AcrA (membrane-fusion protein)